MAFADFAPAANIFIPQFDEIDWPFMFIFPFDGKHLPLTPVDLDDGAGPDQRPHGEVGQTDYAVDGLLRGSKCWIRRNGISPQISTSRDKRFVLSSRKSGRERSGTTMVSPSSPLAWGSS